ncbi:MAG: hypothetical protein M1816_002068 [Peltula sp. TS41687]|nr:MAG: hypothetical protein M1816_002068 [Peltula sp. TS41687]
MPGKLASWTGQPSIKGSSESMRMALLTFTIVGITFTWSTEMTYCTPYLLQLGLPKSQTSLVWVAGPLSGILMQPVVGAISDRSKSRWGRRRPFMLGGAMIVAICMIFLGWTAEIAGLFTQDPSTRRTVTIVLAVLSIYAVDFAINAVQSTSRSLIIDTLPISKQQLGSAWASRMVAIGNLIGYGVGTLDLVKVFGKTLGDTQFKQLCVISATALLASVSITSYAVQERILVTESGQNQRGGVLKVFSQIKKTATHLPRGIQAICWVQFWSWIGWFPFLFYSTTWIGETYLRYEMQGDVQSKDTVGEIGRIGSFSLVIFSLISLASSVILPWVVQAPEQEKGTFTPRPPPRIAHILPIIVRYKPALLTAWTASHFIFAGSMLLAPFVRSVRFASIIVATCGIPWALQSFAPYTFMGIQINRISNSSTPSGGQLYRRRLSDASDTTLELNVLDPDALHLNHHNDDDDAAEMSTSTGELAGVYLGILNLFVTLPQFVGTLMASVIFAILEPGKSPELAKEVHPDEQHRPTTTGPNAIAVCLFIGALSALGAAYATTRLRYVF